MDRITLGYDPLVQLEQDVDALTESEHEFWMDSELSADQILANRIAKPRIDAFIDTVQTQFATLRANGYVIDDRRVGADKTFNEVLNYQTTKNILLGGGK